MAEFRAGWAGYRQYRDGQVLPLSAQGRKAEAYRILTEDAVPPYKSALTALDALFNHQIQQNDALVAPDRGSITARGST